MFFGVCTATAWTAGLALTAVLQQHYERGIVAALVCGTLAGITMFFTVIR